MDQELCLLPPLPVKISFGARPIPSLDDLPVYSIQPFSTCKELSHRLDGVTVGEAPRTVAGHGMLDAADEVNDIRLPSSIPHNVAPMNGIQHRRTICEVEGNVIGKNPSGSDGLPGTVANRGACPTLFQALVSDPDALESLPHPLRIAIRRSAQSWPGC